MSTQIDTTPQRTEHAPPRPSWARRRALIIGAAVAAAVAALVIAVNLGSLGNISIVSGWFPVFLFWITTAFCVLAVATRRHVLREFAIGIPVGIGFTAVLFAVLQLTQAIPAGAPRSMYAWLIVTCLVAGLVLAGWRRAGWLRRILGVGAVGLCVLSAGSVANQTFQYYPTFDRLFGKTANNFIDNTQLNAIREEVAKTGKLPDHGATLSVAIPGQGLKFTPRQAYVWVPPAWFAPSRPQLPVIELLHGVPGQPSDWTRASYADATSLAFAKEHNGVAPILVMPDINGGLTADSECMNSTMFGQVETYLTKAVPEFMQKNFNARTRVGSFAIAGLSEGGTCAVTLALNNPKTYPVFANYSGDVSPQYQEDTQQQTIADLFGGSVADFNAHNPPYLLAHNRYAGLSGWFEAGQQDPPSEQAAHTLRDLAAKAGIDTCITTPPGAHNFDFFTTAFQNSLPWMSWKLGLTPQPSSVAAQCASGAS
jgi:S-formylglutathione hydrolase FrmB